MSMHPDLEPWIAELAPRLGLRPDEVPIQLLLDVARDVAHDAVRPGAPVSTFMIGLALGRADIATTDDAQRAIADALAARGSRDGASGAVAEPVATTTTARPDEADEAITTEPDEHTAEADAAGIGGDDDGSGA